MKIKKWEEMSKKEKIVGFIIIFTIFSIFVSIFSKSDAPKKETGSVSNIVVTKPVEIKTIETEKNLAKWKELKSIDDAAMSLAGDQLLLCSDGLTASMNQDTKTLLKLADELSKNNDKVTALKNRRIQLLSELGY